MRHYTTCHKILDIEANNAYVLFKLQPTSTGFTLNHRARYRFLMMLVEIMIKPNMVTRPQLATGLNLSTTMAFQSFNLEVRPQANQHKIAKE